MNRYVKRIIALLLSVMLLLSMTGCSSEDGFSLHSIVDTLSPIFGIEVPPEADQIIDGVDNMIGDLGELVDGVGGLIDSSTNPNATIENEKLSVTMLNVGQGLSILFESDGKYMLYDGGDKATSSYVVSYLQKHGVAELEYMIASHYDSDHIAGLVGVLETTAVKNVINPDYQATTKIYQSYVSGVEKSGAKVIYPNVGDTFVFGHATITVLAPARDYGDPNEMSVAIRVDCGQFSCVVTGDAETESESDMLTSGIPLECDLYVVGHHGSSSSSSDAFVAELKASHGFISCGKDNDYGHPTQQTLDTLEKYNIDLYRSDRDGEVSCVTDGKYFKFSD